MFPTVLVPTSAATTPKSQIAHYFISPSINSQLEEIREIRYTGGAVKPILFYVLVATPIRSVGHGRRLTLSKDSGWRVCNPTPEGRKSRRRVHALKRTENPGENERGTSAEKKRGLICGRPMT